MSEPRKNHLSIDGGQVKEDDHVASYKPIPESDTDFRSSKTSLKSKEKASPDGAEEKLLSKEDEAKIVRVDMADAKYVVGDHRNGDAKIELDANKRQFSGLTKEELMKYAEDPFWVNLRWCMFVLFWAMWLAMLAGAITIIIRAPRCAAPTEKDWLEKYAMVESEGKSLDELKDELSVLKCYAAHGVFVDVQTYDSDGDSLSRFEDFAKEAKKSDLRVIADLTPTFVSTTHPWFVASVNRSAPYDDYFVWANVTKYDASGNPMPPNNWVSTTNTPAWKYHEARKQFYLAQNGEDKPDLNFWNEKVVQEFSDVLKKWVQAGAMGVRLNKARQLLVNPALPDEVPDSGRGSDRAADMASYTYWRHQHTMDLHDIEGLLATFAAIVDNSVETKENKVFTMKEEGLTEYYLLARNASFLRPPSAAPVAVEDAGHAARELTDKLQQRWPLLQLTSGVEADPELALFSMVLPATPVFTLTQVQQGEVNGTTMNELVALREDASIQHGNHSIVGVPDGNSTKAKLLACARWKASHTGYVAVYNPTEAAARANLTGMPSLPASLTVHVLSHQVKLNTNYTKNSQEQADNVLVPAKSTVVLSYVPQATTAS